LRALQIVLLDHTPAIPDQRGLAVLDLGAVEVELPVLALRRVGRCRKRHREDAKRHAQQFGSAHHFALTQSALA
jgi:hypothetical protein